MFSDQDVQDIIRLIPPGKVAYSEPSKGLPSLVFSSTGNALIASNHIEHRFSDIIEYASRRLSIDFLSRDLDVDHEVIYQLARLSPSLILLSGDKSHVIARDEADYIEQRLQELGSKRLISKVAFAQENDISIESVDILEHKLKDVLVQVDGHLLSQQYHYSLMETLEQKLNKSLENAVAVECAPETLQNFPMWYISSRLNWLLKVTHMESQFRVETSANTIRCIPRQSVVRKRDAEITRLRAGDVPSIDLRVFLKEFGELYSSDEDFHHYLSTLTDISLIQTIAVSNIWLNRFSAECVQFLEINDYVDFTGKMKDCFPSDCRNDVASIVEEQIRNLYQQSPGHALYRVGDYIVTQEAYTREHTILLNQAKSHALSIWGQLKEYPDKDHKFQISEITTIGMNEHPLRSAMTRDRSIEKAIDEQYWNEMSSLESKNEAEFSAFWNERAVSKIQIYTEGLKHIEDTKLREQLADLLSAYVQKELFPDLISKARTQGLILSKKTHKQMQKFENVLNAGRLDISNLITTIEKFGKKQGIPTLEMTSLMQTKNLFVSEMVRKIQKKQTDGPLLFLTLIVVLLAKQQQGIGVVYATGKYAPKLLKQLKSALSVERYGELEAWKERAKTGTLTPEDRDRMKRLAVEL